MKFRERPPISWNNSSGYIYLLGIFIIVGVLLIWKSPFTGDEPRYHYYQVSLYENGNLYIPHEKWQSYLKKNKFTPSSSSCEYKSGQGIVLEPGAVPFHAIGYPLLVNTWGDMND